MYSAGRECGRYSGSAKPLRKAAADPIDHASIGEFFGCLETALPGARADDLVERQLTARLHDRTVECLCSQFDVVRATSRRTRAAIRRFDQHHGLSKLRSVGSGMTVRIADRSTGRDAGCVQLDILHTGDQ
jgi:hypothetical protein